MNGKRLWKHSLLSFNRVKNMLLYENLLKEEIIMKSLMYSFGLGVVGGIGVMLGYWLWENKLEEKVDDFDDYLKNKRKEKGL